MDPQETKIFIAVVITILVVTMGAVYFVLSVKRQHKRVLQLQKEMANAEITALEKDRYRIATDLHDDLAPMLSAVKMKISSFDLVQEDDLQQLSSCNEIINDMSRKMREISFDLMPVTLVNKGVFMAIEEFVQQVSKQSPLNIQVHLPEKKDNNLPGPSAIHIYRIVKELVQNCQKHARATQLKIQFQSTPNKLILITEDNGTGFDYNRAIDKKSGLGLNSILNRIEMLNAVAQVESETGKGTIYKIEIPVKHEPASTH